MMWFYAQSTGLLRHDDEEVSCGYSGAGTCKNDPAMQHVHNKGPIPRGLYRLETPRDSNTHGPYVIGLKPSMDNAMCGRGAFLIHGDSINEPGAASQGCIILGRMVRHRMWSSCDHDLEVIS